MAGFNELRVGEAERLAVLIEECAEVQQIACKVLRHGYDSFHPDDKDEISNRTLLETELGDLCAAIYLMRRETDLDWEHVKFKDKAKRQTIFKYLHHTRP